MQKWKCGHHFVKNHHTAEFQITNSPPNDFNTQKTRDPHLDH